MAKPKPFVFISYARANSDRIAWVTENLEHQGIAYFIDRHMPTGSLWESILQQKVRDCSAVVVAWTSESIVSEWVAREVAEALANTKTVVPLRLDHVAPPAQFNHINVADLRDWQGNFGHPEWQKVIDQLPVSRASRPLSKASFRNLASTVPNQEPPPSERWTRTLRAKSPEQFRSFVDGLHRQGFRPVSLDDETAQFERENKLNPFLVTLLFVAGIVPGLIYLQVHRKTPRSETVRVVRLG